MLRARTDDDGEFGLVIQSFGDPGQQDGRIGAVHGGDLFAKPDLVLGRRLTALNDVVRIVEPNGHDLSGTRHGRFK